MRLSPVAIEKIAVLRATARPVVVGGGAASPCALAVAAAVGSVDTGQDATDRGGGYPRCRRRRPPPRYTDRRLMANIHSQQKRILRAERERLENRRYTSTIKTFFRRLEAAVASGDETAAAAEHRTLVRTIDKAIKRGALHRNTGARKKSRAARIRRGDESA